MRLSLQNGGPVHVGIYDLFGRRVRTLLDGPVAAGATAVSWDGHGEHGAPTSSGIYFARATCAGGRSMLRVALIH
jgi:hypothetical protein